MLVHRETPPASEPTRLQVIGYIEELVVELADFAAKHGSTALAAALSIVATQAAGERLSATGER